MNTLHLNKIEPKGITGTLADGIIKNWLLGLRETNPAILDMFAEREKTPYRDLLPWSGEFAGKYITSAYYIYMLTRNEELRSYVESFIDEFISYQAEDGYLGCFQKQARLTGGSSTHPVRTTDNTWLTYSWDAWNHYHAMYGLYLWYKLNGNERYLEVIHKIAELFDKIFFNEETGNKRLVDIGENDKNLAPYHIFAVMAQETNDPLYLKLAREIELDFEDERAGKYISTAEQKMEFYQTPMPRWESLHAVMGIAEMAQTTGEEHYLEAALWIYDSIIRTDIHNTGGFSSDEGACGTPYKNHSIETCCVVAFNALASLLYTKTGRADIVDFLELAHYNAVLGFYSPSGYWSTYTTYMEGTKCANYHHITFQSRPGSPNLNCCSVNAPRGVGQLTEWMLTEQNGVTYINLYESLTAEADGLSIDIESDYPAPGKIKVTLRSDAPRKIALRIPKWSKNSVVTLDGKVLAATAGEYLMLPEMKWEGNDLALEFDFSYYTAPGHLAYEGKQSIYYGPLLFGCDSTLVECDVTCLPAIKQSALESNLPKWREDGRIVLELGGGLTFCDFRTLGVSGATYVTYMTIE